MPWRGPEVPGEFPTLGYEVIDFIEEHCVIPDGDRQGDRYLLTDEMQRFLLWFYRLEPETGRFYFDRGGQIVRPQKWGKGPFAAAIICAEGAGPVLFDGWDAKGDPVGRQWATPHIEVTASSEDQAGNVWHALVPMIERGELQADIPDTGETRINLPGGGRIVPVTASPRSRLGQRVTFVIQDETHSWWKSNGGRAVADNQRRNVAGMGGRFLETTNAWDPIDESVAQSTSETRGQGVYLDDVEPGVGSVKNKRDRRKMLRIVYGDSLKGNEEARVPGWVELDRIDAECEALIAQGDPAQAERFFLNRKRAEQGAAFDIEKWAGRARDYQADDGALITIGVDGARFEDALAVVATEVETGFQWPLGIWERPLGAPEDYEHPADEIDGTMLDAFERFEVWRVYCDPQWIEHLTIMWAGRWGDRIVHWYTNRPKPAGHMVREYVTAAASDVIHPNDEKFNQHIRNSRRKHINVYDDQGRRLYILTKDRPMSPHKIDAAMAAALSWKARSDAIVSGAETPPPEPSRIPVGF